MWQNINYRNWELAKQADGSVLVRYDDNVISTAVASKEKKDTDFFPLTVNYEENYMQLEKFQEVF